MSEKQSRRKGRARLVPDEPIASSVIVKPPVHTVTNLWTDGLGRVAIRAVQVLIVGVLAAFIVIGILRLSLIALPVLLALILSSALWPLVRLLRKFMPAMLAAWTVFLGSLLVLGGIGTLLVYSVLAEWPKLVDKGIEGFNKLQGMLDQLPWKISQEQIDQAIKQATDFLTSSQFSAGALSGISAAGNFFTGLVLLLVILFFFLKDGDRIWAFFVSWVPAHQKHRWLASGERTVETLGGYMRGTSTVAAVDALGITAALLILQVPLAIPLGVVVFMSSFIPLVGATFAGILATLIALVTNGPVVALIVLGAVILVNQLEGNFLQPVVMAHALNLHALVVLLALAAGTVLGGLVGAVLAVPLMAVAWSITKIWTDRDVRPPATDKDEKPDVPSTARILAHVEARIDELAEPHTSLPGAGSSTADQKPSVQEPPVNNAETPPETAT
ncbi:AI-2E family transporter [Arthrobacter sp. MYb227]|uniref:AI-2E family transporter n=1 Tax=Arthrobacter sp. MYb227 TaxID=1848601 RepID=UPI000CFC9A05|nr:AI-2E family transporter [Arthrobacter sp. MYb227]PQZ87752.1 AI-2E family transporter [Arthrobacter sp. MYb227]